MDCFVETFISLQIISPHENDAGNVEILPCERQGQTHLIYSIMLSIDNNMVRGDYVKVSLLI